jgi:hypothetical protein
MAEMRMNQLMRDCLVVGIIGWVPGGVAIWVLTHPLDMGEDWGDIVAVEVYLILTVIACVMHLVNLGIAAVCAIKGLATATSRDKIFLLVGAVLSVAYLIVSGLFYATHFVDMEG